MKMPECASVLSVGCDYQSKVRHQKLCSEYTFILDPHLNCVQGFPSCILSFRNYTSHLFRRDGEEAQLQRSCFYILYSLRTWILRALFRQNRKNDIRGLCPHLLIWISGKSLLSRDYPINSWSFYSCHRQPPTGSPPVQAFLFDTFWFFDCILMNHKKALGRNHCPRMGHTQLSILEPLRLRFVSPMSYVVGTKVTSFGSLEALRTSRTGEVGGPRSRSKEEKN